MLIKLDKRKELRLTCDIPELESQTFSVEISQNFEAKIAADSWIDSGVEFTVTVLVQNGSLTNAGVTNDEDFNEKRIGHHCCFEMISIYQRLFC